MAGTGHRAGRHRALTKALTDELVSVSLPAVARMSDERSAVFVTIGGQPAQVRINIDGRGFCWQIADLHQGHNLPLDTPVSDIVELVAVCLAKRCADVPVLAAQLPP